MRFVGHSKVVPYYFNQFLVIGYWFLVKTCCEGDLSKKMNREGAKNAKKFVVIQLKTHNQ